MDVLDGTHVQAPGGLDGDEQLGVPVNFPGHDGLLLVSAGHTPGDGDAALAAADIILLDQPVGIIPDGLAANEAQLLEFRFPIALEHHVVFQGIVQHQAVLVAVLRDVGHPLLAALADGRLGNVGAVQGDRSGAYFFQAGEGIDKFRLAVAFDTGQADDLPFPDLQAGVLHSVAAVDPGGNGEPLHLEDGLTGFGGLLVGNQLHIPAHHQAGHLLHTGLGHLHGAHILALAEHGAAVGHGFDLRQLVGDEQDGFALFFERAHDFHQLVDLLGGEDGGGLVENQNFIVPVEHFQDLHPLLHTHGNIRDLGIRVHLQSVTLGQLQHPLPGRLAVDHQAVHGFGAQNDVVQHREAFHQLKMLVHHADVQGSGIVGVVDSYHLAVLFDHAGFRLVQTKQDAHQGGFSRAVLTQQGVDLPPPQLEGHVIIGLDAGKLLGDVQHFYHIVCHMVTPHRVFSYYSARSKKTQQKSFSLI